MRRLFLFGLLIGLVVSVSLAQDESARIIEADLAADVVKLVAVRGHLDTVRGVAFSPDSNYLASGGEDLTLRLWHVASAGQVFSDEAHAGFVTGVDFGQTAEDDWLLASVGWDRVVNVMRVPPDNPADAEVAGTFEGANGALSHVAFSPDSTQLAFSAGSGTLFLLDATTYTEMKRYTLPSLETTALAFNTDGSLLAAAPGFPATDVLLFQVQADADEPFFTLDHERTVTGLAFAPGGAAGHALVTATEAGELTLWALDDAEATVVGSAQTDDVWYLSAAYHPSGELLATASLEGLVQLWDVRDPENPVVQAVLDGHDAFPVYDVAFSPDGTLLASAGGDGMIALWGLPLPD